MKEGFVVSPKVALSVALFIGMCVGVILSDITQTATVAPAYAAGGSGKYTIVSDANSGSWILNTETGWAEQCKSGSCYITN